MAFHALEHVAAAKGARLRAVTAETQGSDYEACTADIDGALWRVRTARITPTKPGAFVAVWRRGPDGETEPFDAGDPTAGLLVLVPDGPRFGAFAFPGEVLCALGVYSSSSSAGKRGFRLYPAWSTGLNPQAERTRAAQAPYFEQVD
ncbi:MepB family protein [Tsukamurella sp. M9C]|uniref:MepB family protein n=1 Tax=Tsukamurella sp. M9C TaxID=2877520 RepID=UPI001CCE03C4|nr:MepB family protein [Tsukamurella sp. M9C]MCA0155259.1 MepB family protein [Tsukamurella sp. M9C]